MRVLLLISILVFCECAWSAQTEQISKAVASGVPISSVASEPVSESKASAVVKPINTGDAKSEKSWLDRFLEDPVATFTGLLFVATLFLWLATRALVKDAKETSKRQSRAFVFLEGFNVELTVATDGDFLIEHLPERYRDCPSLWVTRFAVQPRWKNGGDTPTKKMTIRVNWRGTEGSIPPEYIYRNPQEPFFIAPQAIVPSTFIEIPAGFAREHINYAMNPIGEHPMLFIWGRADYEDVFGDSHFVEWCYQVRFEDHRREGLRASFIQWGEYNHTD